MQTNIHLYGSVVTLVRRYGTSAVACGLAFVMGWTLAMQIPLQSRLIQDFVIRKSSSSSSVRSANAQRTRTILRTRWSARLSSSSRRPSILLRSAAPEMLFTPIEGPLRGANMTQSQMTPIMMAAGFPAFDHATYPVTMVPNWGAMHAAAEWNRDYDEMTMSDFVPVPEYDMSKLTVPLKSLLNPREDDELTRKLFYSTRFFGAYDLDAGEFTAVHPGVDLKLALGTPLGAIAGGKVNSVEMSDILGLRVIIEHRIGSEVFYSIYGHLGSAAVQAGDVVRPGTLIGTVGLTGNTGGPHVHLQVDRGHGETIHVPYLPKGVPSPAEADKWVVNPIKFIEQYANGI